MNFHELGYLNWTECPCSYIKRLCKIYKNNSPSPSDSTSKM